MVLKIGSLAQGVLALVLSSTPGITQELTPELIVAHPARAAGDFASALTETLDALEADPTSPWVIAALEEAEELARLLERPLPAERLERLAARITEPVASVRVRALLQEVSWQRRFSDEPHPLEGDLWSDFVAEWCAIGPLGPLEHPAPLRRPPVAGAPKTGLRTTHECVWGEPLEWRPLPRGAGLLWVRPGRGTPFPGPGVIYLVAHLAHEGPAQLEVATEDTLNVWWNGELVLDLPQRGSGETRRRFLLPVVGAPGWNQLLVRVENRPSTRIAARLLDERGETPLGARELDVPYTELPRRPDWIAPAAAPPALPDRGEGYERAIHVLEERAAGHADRALAVLPPQEPGPRAAWLRVRHQVLAQAGHLPPEVRRRAVVASEDALADFGPLPPVTAAFRAARLVMEDKPVEGLAEIDALTARVGEVPFAGRVRVTAFQALDSTGTLARLELERLVELFPGSPRLAELLALARTAAGDRAGALGLWRRALAGLGAREEVQEGALLAHARAGGEHLTYARTVLEEWAAADPSLVRPLELLRSVLEIAGDDAALLRSARAQVQRAPLDPIARGRLARLLLARGHFAEGIQELGARSALEGGGHGARVTRAILGEEDPAERFFATFAPDRAEALAAAAAGAAQGASIAEVLDSGMLYFLPDGSSHARYHTITRALDRKGTELLHSSPLADHTRLARVLKADGRILEPVAVAGEWVLPSLEPGDAFELVWDEYATGLPGAPPGIGWWRFASFEKPFVRSRYAIYVPDGLPGRLELLHFEGEHSERPFAGGTVHLLLERDRPREEDEPLRPSYEEILPWAQYGGDLPLEWVAAVWNDRLHTLTHLTADVEAELVSLLEEVDRAQPDLDARARAEALYDRVTAHVLDFGGTATAGWTWSLRRGNPIFLLGALLDLAGIDHEWAVLERGVAPELDREPLRAFENRTGFNLPAIRLPGPEPLWILAPQGRGLEFGAIPAELAGASVLVLGEEGERREQLSRAELADTWNLDLTVRYALGADGGVSADCRLRVTTTEGSLLREQLSEAGEVQRRGAARGFAAQLVPGIDPEAFEFPRLEESGAPFEMLFSGPVPRFLEGVGERRSARLPLQPTGLAKGVGSADRRWPLALRLSRRERVRIVIDLGDAWRVSEAPVAFREEAPGYQHSLLVEDGPQSWSATRTFLLRGRVLEPEEVPPFLTREAELEREVRRAVTLERRR